MALEATATPNGLPEGITKPLAGINSQDQSGLLAILTAFSLGIILLSIATRIYVRHEFRLYRIDDYTFFAATVCIPLIFHMDVQLNCADPCGHSNLIGLQGTSIWTGKSGRSCATIRRSIYPEGKLTHGQGPFNPLLVLTITLCSLNLPPTFCTSSSSSSQNAAYRSYS
jgi:hypothetical protein